MIDYKCFFFGFYKNCQSGQMLQVDAESLYVHKSAHEADVRSFHGKTTFFNGTIKLFSGVFLI